ncbi:MAG: extracellular solute-binding protein [Clostridiaceae bacterium]|nr:extracellular solute-binding protein [Clostridiaceae bacterium]
MLKKGTVLKVIALVLSCMFVLALAGCGQTGTQNKPTPAPTNAPQQGSGTQDGDGREMVGNMYKTGLPIVKEPVKYYAMGLQMNNTRPSNLDESELFVKIMNETNVFIEWDLIPQASWTETKNLKVASGEYPDFFYGPKSLSHDEVQKYGADGVLIDIEALLDEYAPNINKIREAYPLYDGFIRSMDGKIYQLASFTDEGFDSHISSIINKEWLDNLGLQVPTNTDELYAVLKAFKENDPNRNGKQDEIPMSFLYQEGNDLNREVKRDFRPIYYAFGVVDTPFYIWINENDEVVFTATTEEWKQATAYMAKLYQEGLIDTEVFTQDRTLLTNKLRTQKNVGVYFDYRKDLSMILEEDQEKFTFIPALKSPDGKQIWGSSQFFSEGGFAITSAAKNPEVLIRFIDHCNSEEYSVQMAFGMFKEAGWDKSEALVPSETAPGKYEVNSGARPEGVEPSEWPMSAPIAQGCTLLTKAALDKYVAEKASSVAKTEACEVYRPYLSKWPYNYAFKFSPEELEELSLLQTDIVQYVIQTHSRWMSEGGIEKEWDAYVAHLNNLGLQRYIELYRTAFERVEK